VDTGYYSVIGTVRSSSAADQIRLTADVPSETDIDLTLIAKRIISGTVTLPDGEIAPAGGVSVTVTAVSGSDKATANVVIPEGLGSANYTLKVPPKHIGKRISCQLSNFEQKFICRLHITVCAGL